MIPELPIKKVERKFRYKMEETPGTEYRLFNLCLLYLVCILICMFGIKHNVALYKQPLILIAILYMVILIGVIIKFTYDCNKKIYDK